jgi:hypothetical protein
MMEPAERRGVEPCRGRGDFGNDGRHAVRETAAKTAIAGRARARIGAMSYASLCLSTAKSNDLREPAMLKAGIA